MTALHALLRHAPEIDVTALPPLVPCFAPSTPFDPERSRILGRAVRARNRRCFKNALRVVLRDGISLRYAEGFVVRDDDFMRATDHAWVVDARTGVVIDPTPAYREREHDREPTAYFAVRTWDVGQIRETVDATQPARRTRFELPLLGPVPQAGSHAADWYRAHIEAQMHAAALHERVFGTPKFGPDFDLGVFLPRRRW